MRHSLLFSALVATALSGMTPALAADEDMPPEFRSSTFEVYTGVFGAANALRSDYTTVVDTTRTPGELDGNAFSYGFRAGFDYVMDGWLVGAVGDWSFGGEVASDTAGNVDASLPNLGTLRARAGVTLGNSLVYLTGGIARSEVEISSNLTPFIGDRNAWGTSWTVGGGIDVGITDSLSMGVEYLYVDIPDQDFSYERTAPAAPAVIEQKFDAVHTIRVGMNYAFQI